MFAEFGRVFLLSFVLLVGVSLCSDDFSIRLLWLSMICLVLFMQL